MGTFGGSEDHTAIMLCEAAELRQYSFCPTRLEARVPFPTGLTLLIAVSGATAQKGAERLRDYNDAALLARDAAAAAISDGFIKTVSGEHTPPMTLAGVVAAAAAQLQSESHASNVRNLVHECIAPRDHGGAMWPDGALCRRFEQFFDESEVLVGGVARALAKGDGAALGSLVDRSQALTESHLKNTLEETEWLPRTARRLGCLAASAFGAGFGGSVWALARAEEAEAMLEGWESAYAEAYPARRAQARFFAMRTPGPGARSVG